MSTLPIASSLVGSRLVDDALVVVLVPVRNINGVHYVRRSPDLKPEEGPALCGATADLDAFKRPRWRRVRTARRVCNGCHAEACAVSSRVSWL